MLKLCSISKLSLESGLVDEELDSDRVVFPFDEVVLAFIDFRLNSPRILESVLLITPFEESVVLLMEPFEDPVDDVVAAGLTSRVGVGRPSAWSGVCGSLLGWGGLVIGESLRCAVVSCGDECCVLIS